jgi:hypothetical protein
VPPDLPGRTGARRAPALAASGYIAVYAVVQWVVAALNGFHPAVNDVIGMFAIARGVEWSDPATLHNGFFPIGLPALLASMPPPSWLSVGTTASIMFGAVALGATWVIAERLTTAWWAVLAVVALSADPTFATYVASAGPDVIALGIAMAGIACYVREATTGRDPRLWVVACSGLLVGAAGLFRYHVAVFSVALIVWSLAQGRRRSATTAAAVAGIAVGYSPQVIVNLLGGFGPLANSGAFTMYQSVVDINWLTTGSIDPAAYATPLTVITQHPFEFAAAYFQSVTSYAVPIALVATALLVRRRAGTGLVWVSLLAGVVGYAAVVSTGNSPRGALAVAPVAAVAVTALADRAFDLTRTVGPAWQRAVAVVTLTTALVVAPGVRTVAAGFSTRHAQEDERAAVERAVARYGIADSAAQILTNDLNLYLADLPGLVPDSFGGWTSISLNGTNAHTNVDVTSAQSFVCDAAARGIRVVLWQPGNVVPAMAEDLAAALSGAATVPGLRFIGAIDSYQASTIEPGFLCP